MKITKQRLKRIIKEETIRVLKEVDPDVKAARLSKIASIGNRPQSETTGTQGPDRKAEGRGLVRGEKNK